MALFYDEDERVRTEASNWCRSVSGEMLGMLLKLVGLYVRSPAYADDEQPLLWALDHSAAPISELGLRAVEIFIEHRRGELGDITKSAAGAAITASKLAMRAYTSSSAPQMRDRALDAIDRLLAARVSHMDELVGHFDQSSIPNAQ